MLGRGSKQYVRRRGNGCKKLQKRKETRPTEVLGPGSELEERFHGPSIVKMVEYVSNSDGQSVCLVEDQSSM